MIENKGLTRDYLEIPLSNMEKPTKEDLVNLYIEQNLRSKDIALYFKRSEGWVNILLKKYDIKKPKELSQKCKERGMIEKYGASNPSLIKEMRKKAENTMLERYGVNNAMYSNELKGRLQKTMLERYGTLTPCENEEIKNKLINNNLKKYGVTSTAKLENIKEMTKQINLEKYGVDNYSKLPEAILKIKERFIEKYGVDNYVRTEEYKERSVEIQEKIYQTKKRKNSFNYSSDEKLIEQFLIAKFPDLKTQYKEDRYPFHCDFYIPSLDLFIEYNGTWTHGGEPYNGTKSQLKIVEDWLNKSKELNFKGKPKTSYLGAIDIWTRLDPLKRKVSKDNKLNWVEFFNMEDLERYFK